MASKVKVVNKNKKVDGLFDEVQEEINEDIIKDAKLEIKQLLQQRVSAEKVLSNLDRQIAELKLKISQDLG